MLPAATRALFTLIIIYETTILFKYDIINIHIAVFLQERKQNKRAWKAQSTIIPIGYE